MAEITVTIATPADDEEPSTSELEPESATSSALVPFVSSNEPRLEILIPDFKLTSWSPKRGVDFLSLMALPHLQQTEHVCKIRTSLARRQIRRRHLQNKVSGQGRFDEKNLFMATSQNDTKTVEELLARGVDPCMSDSKKRTALHIAASKGHDSLVSVLLKHGANPNQRDCIGNTPLHLAVCCNHTATVSILLEAGTDVSSCDNAGRTPMHLAQSRINVLQKELQKGQAEQHVKDEVLQVASMMNRYLRVRGDNEGVNQLTDLCNKLQLSSTREELSSVNNLLEAFTSLSIHKPGHS